MSLISTKITGHTYNEQWTNKLMINIHYSNISKIHLYNLCAVIPRIYCLNENIHGWLRH